MKRGSLFSRVDNLKTLLRVYFINFSRNTVLKRNQHMGDRRLIIEKVTDEPYFGGGKSYLNQMVSKKH